MLKRTTYLQEPLSAPAKSNGTISRMNHVQDVLGKGWVLQMVSSFHLSALYPADQFAERGSSTFVRRLYTTMTVRTSQSVSSPSANNRKRTTLSSSTTCKMDRAGASAPSPSSTPPASRSPTLSDNHSSNSTTVWTEANLKPNAQLPE